MAGWSVVDILPKKLYDYLTNVKVNISDSTGTSDVDVEMHSISVIEHSHKEMHEGNNYIATGIFSVSSSGYLDIRVKPSTIIESHMVFAFAGDEGKFTVLFYENPIFSADGTNITAINNNRKSIKTSSLSKLQHTPTITSNGTLLYHVFSGATKTAEATSSRREFILKKDTEYLLRVQNNHNGTQNICVELDWYEPID